MSEVRFTRNAFADLDGIADYTRREHGARQLLIYLDALEDCFARLAEYPELGTACDFIRPGLRQQQQGHHVVFYVSRPYGVRVVRVLHERMDPKRHDLTDDENDGP